MGPQRLLAEGTHLLEFEEHRAICESRVVVLELAPHAVDLSFTVPATNTDGTRPANLSSADVYAITDRNQYLLPDVTANDRPVVPPRPQVAPANRTPVIPAVASVPNASFVQ